MTWRELLAHGEKCLENAQISEASLDAWYLLAYVSQMDRAQFFLRQQESVPHRESERYHALLRERAKRKPLQYLTGEQEFMGLVFAVSPDVLIPRQDTECLVERLLPCVKGKRVLDVCTGSGCIAVSLAKLGAPAEVAASDLSERALVVAKNNAQRNGVSVSFCQSDMLRQIQGRYDVIVSNPPYICASEMAKLQPEVACYEPEMALCGGEDGLQYYRRLVAEAPAHLEMHGMLAVEIGYDQGEAVTALFKEHGFAQVGCSKDLCGKDRIVLGTMGKNPF